MTLSCYHMSFCVFGTHLRVYSVWHPGVFLPVVSVWHGAATLWPPPPVMQRYMTSLPSQQAAIAHKNMMARSGDHPTLVNVYGAFIAAKADMQWCRKNFVNWHSLCRARKIRAQVLFVPALPGCRAHVLLSQFHGVTARVCVFICVYYAVLVGSNC